MYQCWVVLLTVTLKWNKTPTTVINLIVVVFILECGAFIIRLTTIIIVYLP